MLWPGSALLRDVVEILPGQTECSLRHGEEQTPSAGIHLRWVTCM